MFLDIVIRVFLPVLWIFVLPLLAVLIIGIIQFVINFLSKYFTFFRKEEFDFSQVYFISLIVMILFLVFGYSSIETWQVVTLISAIFMAIFDVKLISSFFPISKIDEFKLYFFKLLYLLYIPWMYISVYKINGNLKVQTFWYAVELGTKRFVLATIGLSSSILLFLILSNFKFIKNNFLALLGIENSPIFKGRWDYLDKDGNLVEGASIYINSRLLFDNFSYIISDDDEIRPSNYELKRDDDSIYIEANKKLEISFDEANQILVIDEKYKFIKYNSKEYKEKKSKVSQKHPKKTDGNLYRYAQISIFDGERKFYTNEWLVEKVVATSVDFFDESTKEEINEGKIEKINSDSIKYDNKEYLKVEI